MYVLFNPEESKNNMYWEEECYGFWEADFGYVELGSATIFTEEEKNKIGYMVPFRCIWIELPKYKGEK
ncbi:MAG: hypothetical protein WA061_01765 [Microgenomates group bacterium]